MKMSKLISNFNWSVKWKQPLNVIYILVWNLYCLQYQDFLKHNANQLVIYHCGEWVLLQADKRKTDWVRIIRSLRCLTEVSSQQVMGYPLLSKLLFLLLGRGWVVRMWNTSASNLQPAAKQDTHTQKKTLPHAHKKKKVWGGGQTREEK